MPLTPGTNEAARARLLLVLLTLIWGLSWPIMWISLQEVGVFTLRAAGFSISAVSLFLLVGIKGRNPAIPRGRAWTHLVVASLLNLVAFGFLSSFAQLIGSTTRTVIINYSMPIWASLMAWLALGERPDRRATIGLVLCIVGLTTLAYPLISTQAVLSLLLAFFCSLSWAAGTIYMKWARLQEDLLVVTAWQSAIAAIVFLGALPFGGPPPASGPLSAAAILGILYNGLLAIGLAYILWFAIIERLPTATASLGALASPVIGVVSSVVLLGERPTVEDLIGFALILAAAACVLTQRSTRPDIAA